MSAKQSTSTGPPVAAPLEEKKEKGILVLPDSSPNAEVVTSVTQKLRVFHSIARALKLIYWRCKGSQLFLRFRLEEDRVAIFLRHEETVLNALKRIHSVYFDDFWGESECMQKGPLLIREVTSAEFKGNKIELACETEIWVGHKPDDPPDTLAYILNCTPDVVDYTLDVEGEPKREDAFVAAECWGTRSQGINNDAFECVFTFVVIDDFERFSALQRRKP